ncbi:MAG TPA: hypothetical protein VFA59_09570 [Vicinamibacterales bacterium]|nr:hypothetical protein [Vicinamibacterales bacterium]
MIRRLARVLGAAALTLVVGEAAARVFWRVAYGLSLRHAGHVLVAFYPELRRVDGIHPSRGDGHFEILLLGGSVLHPGWGAVEQALVERLERAGIHDVRVTNLAAIGRTSRDSVLNYASLTDARFDRVIVYDGLNDVRANNIPPDRFRDDYGHYQWYETVNAMAGSDASALFALPLTIRFAAVRARETSARNRYMPSGAIPQEWLVYGKSARSVAALEHNLGEIVSIAARRGDPLTLMTFAIHVPSNYSLDRFHHHTLDYDLHVSPIELWGDPANVVSAVDQQNEAVRRLAAAHPDVTLVDQANTLPRGAEYFNDICHLTLAGSSAFAENIVRTLH